MWVFYITNCTDRRFLFLPFVMMILSFAQEHAPSSSCLGMWDVFFDSSTSSSHVENNVPVAKLILAFQCAWGFSRREAWSFTNVNKNILCAGEGGTQ